MRNTLYAVVAACFAMLATSGIVALATAAPAPRDPALVQAEVELTAQLDRAIARQLAQVKLRVLPPAN